MLIVIRRYCSSKGTVYCAYEQRKEGGRTYLHSLGVSASTGAECERLALETTTAKNVSIRHDYKGTAKS